MAPILIRLGVRDRVPHAAVSMGLAMGLGRGRGLPLELTGRGVCEHQPAVKCIYLGIRLAA